MFRNNHFKRYKLYYICIAIIAWIHLYSTYTKNFKWPCPCENMKNYVWIGNNVWWATRQRCWWWCVEVNTAWVFKFCLWDWILPKGYALRRLHQNKFQKRIFCLIAKRIILYQFHFRLYVAKYTFKLLGDNWQKAFA